MNTIPIHHVQGTEIVSYLISSPTLKGSPTVNVGKFYPTMIKISDAIPAEFHQSMMEAERGELIDLDEAIEEGPAKE